MTVIAENLKLIEDKIQSTAQSCERTTDQVQLIAVSKRKPVALITEAIEAGANHFGENYIQEAIEKIDRIGKETATWHFIGHLQSNKAKYAVPYFDYIHTVDSIKLAKEINKQAGKINKTQKIFIQVNISEETTKSGTSAQEACSLIENIQEFEHILINGLMCMPPYFEDPENARKYFRQLADLKQSIMDNNYKNVQLDHLSMGMSNDFSVAIEEGATMVRVGTSIFGERD